MLDVRTISQRELRNDNASIMRAVEAGESFVVTRRGVPVARLGPLPEADLRVVRPADEEVDLAALPRVRAEKSTAAHLDDLRGEQ